MEQPYDKATFYSVLESGAHEFELCDVRWRYTSEYSDMVVEVSHGNPATIGVSYLLSKIPLVLLQGHGHVALNQAITSPVEGNLSEVHAFEMHLVEYLSKHPEVVVLHQFFTPSNQTSFILRSEPRGENILDIQVRSPMATETFREGDVQRVEVNRYLRSSKARERCIAHYSRGSHICCTYRGFDFIDQYGEAGRGVLQVHHLKPLSDGGRDTAPIEDMRPVCGNCHLILHSNREAPYTEAEMKSIVKVRHE